MTENAKRKSIDWETVEKQYRAGILSLREIGKINEVSEGMIRKKAKADSWERDLTERVNEKVRNELVRSEVRTTDPRTEKDIIDDAVNTVVTVVRGHRKRIIRQTELVDILTEQLVEAAVNRSDVEDAIEDETKGDQTGQRKAMMLRSVSLQTHSAIAVNLSNALKTLVGLERQAFNIKDEGEGDKNDTMSTLLAQLQGTPLRPKGSE